jgi:uncharacterized membrane protein YeaQ/YmgE (transglycosylase-associated protein family)
MQLQFLRDGGILQNTFLNTSITLKLFGLPAGGFTLTLIDIIILVLIAYLVSYISEKLTGKKLGGTFKATIITLIGTFIILTFARLPGALGFAIEDIQIIPALLGAIIIAVFYTLIRAQLQKGK